MKGQSSAEYSVLFTVSIFLTLMFFGIAVLNIRSVLEQKKDFEVEKVLSEWEFIAKDIWINGNGSSYIWEGSLPEGYESSKSYIGGNSIVLVVDGRQFVKGFEEFTISGSTPTNRTGIRMKIENDGTKIVFTPV